MSLKLKEKALSIPKGTEDVLGIEMRYREHVLEKIKDVYENFGFSPQKTPILEYFDTFDGHHGEGEKLFFYIKDKDGEKLIPRYDLTVPFARVANMYPNIPRPYKRYQIGPSFRDDEPGNSHFREFTQCDADIIGSKSLLAEVDITTMAFELIKKLGIDNFVLRINHRLLIKALAEKVGLNTIEESLGLQRALDYIDKMSKDGYDGLKNKLIENKIDSYRSNKIALELKDFFTLFTPQMKFEQQIKLIEQFLQKNRLAMKAIEDLKYIFSYLPEEVKHKIKIDLTLARGADYYTGYILEGTAIDSGIGSILGGGRYDNLVSAVGNTDEPAVGLAFGLERLLLVLNKIGASNKSIPLKQKILLIEDKVGSNPKIFDLACKLRKNFDVDLYYEDSSFNEVFHYAQKNNYPLIVEVSEGRKIIHSVIEDREYKKRVECILEAM